MPSPDDLALEQYTWVVIYEDGSELHEVDICLDHEAGRTMPGTCHVFACIDRARTVFLDVYKPGKPRLVASVICDGADVEPIFGRERAIRLPQDGRPQEWIRNRGTWIGSRVVRDGVTVSQDVRKIGG